MSGRGFVWLWFVVVAAIGFFFAGPFFYDTFIGLAPSAFPAGEALQKLTPDMANASAGVTWAVGIVLVLTVTALALFWSRGRTQTDPSRRGFLTGAAAGTAAAVGTMAVSAGAAFGRAFFGFGTGGPGWRPVFEGILRAEAPVTDPNPQEAWQGSRIRAYRRFGRTEFQISDIVLGSGPISGESATEIARLAFDRGVNYVDTSPDYSAHGSEEAMGKALEGRRDEIFVATKFCNAHGHLPPGTPVSEYKAAVESSLQRLRTDHVDLVHIHSCDEVERLLDPNVHEAFDRLKEDGKVRFLGFSSHTPRLPQVANAAIDSGRFDVMMLAYHHGIWPTMGEIIARARTEQDMGVVAMKTLKGAKHDGLANFRQEADAYSQAAFRWVLSNPDVSCAVISFRELAHCDEYLYGSGRSLTRDDVAILEKYDREILGSYCAPHCGACLASCPEQVPIHDVLRQRMYFEDYGTEKEAMRLYARLERNAEACSGCPAPCQGSCPLGVAIPERLRGAHQLLTLS